MMPREQPQKYIPGVQTSELSLNQWRPTYLADPRDRLKSSKPAPKDRRSTALELKHAACKGTAATLGNKAATIGALAQAVADAISATKADLTAVATTARTSRELKPAACKGTALISQHTRAAMIRDDQPKHESSNDPR